MQITLGKTGFCAGVERAVGIALEAAKKYGKVYCLHPLIHNKKVVEDLQNKGVMNLRPDEEIPTGAAVVISAHGCGKETEGNLIKRGYNVIDATCPFVERIHEKIEEYTLKGYNVVIIGDKAHAEVSGSAGRTYGAQIVGEAEEIDFSVSDKFFVTVQSTFSLDKYIEIKKNIENRAKTLSKTVEIFDSICYTTIERQTSAIDIASKCDLVLIVGDRTSSNCRKLYDLAKTRCNEVFFIENVDDLKSLHIKNIVNLGIVSGASTPRELSMEVFYRMSEQSVIDEKVVDEVKEEAVETVETSEEAVKPAPEKKAEPTTMEEAMKAFRIRTYREGTRLKTKVEKADVTGITVAVEGVGKNDCGFIDRDEAEIDGSYDPANYKEGDEIEAMVIAKKNPKDKAISLSKKACDALRIDDEKVKGILAGEEFSLVCPKEIKGGLLGQIGTYTVFVPASQIRMGYVNNLSEYTTKTLRLKALPPREEKDEEGNVKRPRNPKRIVASQRVVLEEEKAAREEEFWSKIYVGAIVTGKVKRFTEFGAFVSLKHMDALVHNSDLSWAKKRITDPGEVLEINKTYEFIVLSADREAGKIALGYKQLQKHPYEIAQEKYPAGTVIEGKVVRIVPFGAFVELEPGIDGLVHISQIQRSRVQNVTDVLKEGDIVRVKVMKYEDERITLSMKALLDEEPVEEEIDETEVASSRPSRTAAFNKRLEGQQEKSDRKDRKSRHAKEESDNEPREYVSGGAGVTLGDLFKIDLKNDEEEGNE